MREAASYSARSGTRALWLNSPRSLEMLDDHVPAPSPTRYVTQRPVTAYELQVCNLNTETPQAKVTEEAKKSPLTIWTAAFLIQPIILVTESWLC